jgi:hypothetical protein
MRLREIKKEIQKQERIIEKSQSSLNKFNIKAQNSPITRLLQNRINTARKKLLTTLISLGTLKHQN